MRNLISFAFFLFLLLGTSFQSNAQLLNRAINRTVQRTADKVADKTADKLADKLSDKLAQSIVDQIENDESMFSVEDTVALKPIPSNHQLKMTGSGPDMHFQYQMSVQTKEQSNLKMNAITHLYLSDNKGARSEVLMQVPILGAIKTIVISPLNQPDQVILINEKNKTYKVESSKNEKQVDKNQYKITKVGTENVYGLSCTHGRVTDENGNTYDFWTTRSVPQYQKMVDQYVKNQQMGSNNFWTAFKKADCDGLIVRMEIPHAGGAALYELLNMEKLNADASLFEIPAGYKKK